MAAIFFLSFFGLCFLLLFSKNLGIMVGLWMRRNGVSRVGVKRVYIIFTFTRDVGGGIYINQARERERERESRGTT